MKFDCLVDLDQVMASEIHTYLLRIPNKILIVLPKQLMEWMGVKVLSTLQDETGSFYVRVEG